MLGHEVFRFYLNSTINRLILTRNFDENPNFRRSTDDVTKQFFSNISLRSEAIDMGPT